MPLSNRTIFTQSVTTREYFIPAIDINLLFMCMLGPRSFFLLVDQVEFTV